ncbi:acetyltransferase (GNAT) family protein [Kineococcus xinjiangensis]|uniref:Acetyltransferase (GNAT) family protein n=1 Tax=Kineococcus xinjiangensis TaxID=512762 RepID=A0A2S6IJ50_9ACTN|nr:GNAT family N-acetyltransferase [Kineococcus xinjiangensis]PPK94247.1 acetyltransferase (GNAT) family protein [Kineococcus xinjiangensis]
MIVNLRRAAPSDADAVTQVLLRSREESALAVVHTPVEVRRWVGEDLIPGRCTWIALVDERIVGVAAVEDDWLVQHYVVPEAQEHGVGRALLDVAKEHSAGALQIHLYQRNVRAQRFYAAAGFVVTAAGNGEANPDGEPDLVMSWRQE